MVECLYSVYTKLLKIVLHASNDCVSDFEFLSLFEFVFEDGALEVLAYVTQRLYTQLLEKYPFLGLVAILCYLVGEFVYNSRLNIFVASVL